MIEPAGLARRMRPQPHDPFEDAVWPKYLRENARRVFKLDELAAR